MGLLSPLNLFIVSSLSAIFDFFLIQISFSPFVNNGAIFKYLHKFFQRKVLWTFLAVVSSHFLAYSLPLFVF